MRIATLCNMDAQGRLVIPAAIRRQINMANGGTLEVETTGADIRLRKSPAYIPKEEQYQVFLNVLHRVISCSAFICTTEHVAASKGVFLPEGSHPTQELTAYLKQNQEFIFPQDEVLFAVSNNQEPVAAIFPINQSAPSYPSLFLVLLRKRGKTLNDMELGSAKLVAATLEQKLI